MKQPMDYQRKQSHRRTGKPGRFNSPARRAWTLARLAERVNTGVLTAASYLRDLGADDDTIRRYASQLGKRVKALAATKGVQPTLSGLAVVGRRLVRCLAYDVRDVEILRAATAGYGRISHLLNGAS